MPRFYPTKIWGVCVCICVLLYHHHHHHHRHHRHNVLLLFINVVYVYIYIYILSYILHMFTVCAHRISPCKSSAVCHAVCVVLWCRASRLSVPSGSLSSGPRKTCPKNIENGWWFGNMNFIFPYIYIYMYILGIVTPTVSYNISLW